MTSNNATGADILAAATTIATELDTLLGAEAPAFGTKLASVVTQIRAAQGLPDAESCAEIEDELYALLVSCEPTRRRLDELLPEVVERRSAFESPYALGEPATRDTYTCTRCSYTWPVLSIDDPIAPPENCPVHPGQPLVFRPASG